MAINNLGPTQRFARSNMILVGVWQGKGKPPFKQYFEAFTKEMNNIQAEGVRICIDTEEVRVKLKVLCCTADIPAKAGLLNMTYFNGSEACITCKEPGVLVRQALLKWNSWLDELFMHLQVHMTGSWTIVHEQFTIQVHEWLKNISWIWKGSWTIHSVHEPSSRIVEEHSKNLIYHL